MTSVIQIQQRQVIMHRPMFNPTDVAYIEQFMDAELWHYLVFCYCQSHLTGSYSFYDELTMLMVDITTTNGWNADMEVEILQAMCRIGNVLYYALANNPTLTILLVSEVSSVQDIPVDSWIITYDPTDALSLAITHGIIQLNGGCGINFIPAAINCPHTTSGDWFPTVTGGM